MWEATNGFMKKNRNKQFVVLYGVLPILFFMAMVVLGMFMLSPIVAPFENEVGRSVHWELTEDLEASNKLKELIEAPAKQIGNSEVLLLTSDLKPTYGDEIGSLKVDGTAVDARLFYGDGNTELHYGVGIYDGAKIPGEGGTVLIAGHTATYFRDFENAEIGAIVTINTYYGEYKYEIVEMKVAEATDTTAYDLEKDEENLIMYTCYPFNTLGYTKDRYFVYGKYISGPSIEVEWNAAEEGRRSR